MSVPRPAWVGPAVAGGVLGVLVGLTPLAQVQGIGSHAAWTLGTGLAVTYGSIGVLVGLLPGFSGTDRSRRAGLFFGLVVGVAYSLPGAVFTMVPYPLAAEADPYWREFANGGWRAFFLTLGFGGLVGGVAGLFRRRGNRD